MFMPWNILSRIVTRKHLIHTSPAVRSSRVGCVKPGATQVNHQTPPRDRYISLSLAPASLRPCLTHVISISPSHSRTFFRPLLALTHIQCVAMSCFIVFHDLRYSSPQLLSHYMVVFCSVTAE